MNRFFVASCIICVLFLIPGCNTYEDGFQDGYEEAQSDFDVEKEYVYDDAYAEGYEEGYEIGCEQGIYDGYSEAYKDGYNDGFYDGNDGDSYGSDELSWWRDHAVIVTAGGEKYHTYGCQYVQGREFYIYNIDLAVSKGYTPCNVCIHQIENNSDTSSTLDRFKMEAELEQVERASKGESVEKDTESSPLGSVCGPLTLMKQRSAEQTP